MDFKLLCMALLVRMLLIFYGTHHDRYFEVKYTDIDYTVFTEAANHTLMGGTPYQTPTYKYTPLLALILLPNISLHLLFGKILFCIVDIVVAMVMSEVMKLGSVKGDFATKVDEVICFCWLFNPFTITISSRGNAEAIQILLVVLTLYFMMSDHTLLSGFFFGLSVHFKIYPFIYGAPFLFYLTKKSLDETRQRNVTILQFTIKMVTSLQNILFGLVSLATFFGMGAFMFSLYGFDFIENTYLFHLSRIDMQHNFSPYFYVLKTTQGLWVGDVINRLAFIPQMGTVLWIGAKFYDRLPLALFLQTFAFVTFNKVCTSQYFIWYIGLLPMAYPYLHIVDPKKNIKRTARTNVVQLAIWLMPQAVWLGLAYLYEFRKLDVLVYVWLASLVFLGANIYLLKSMMGSFAIIKGDEEMEKED
ncbi:GPI mannosyltransferase 1-like [Clytia hemisphaerica]|uniref:GPI alpha-1,4-mannosyltransferase I, catalytic subunit n=1 Tax=Clytia hemisphaerica TaxID=252671 RepID=A0A7M5USK6_9CNID